MKKSLRFLVIAFFALNFLIINKAKAQCVSSVTENITFGPYTCECCGSGYSNPAYFCFNDPGTAFSVGGGGCLSSSAGGVCGSAASSSSLTFTNPVPAGNIVTQIQLTYQAAPCGGTIQTTIDGIVIATDALGNAGCACGNNIFGTVVGSNTVNYPCGLPGYNNGAGATETIAFNFTGSVCIHAVDMVFCYAPASQAVPASQPAAIVGATPVCVGVAKTYSVPAVANATGYTWTVPTGWTINSGQGTNVISATPGSAGNICVTASNLCGTSAQTCFAVTLASNSTAPASATANPTSVCPGNPSTLTVNGGSLGSGASWDWYAGSCNSAVIGTGTSISVSPGSTTTYYVNAVGTCNTTACQSVVVTIGGTTATPGAPTGNTSPCGGSTQTYNTTGTAGATSYTWTVPAGSTINSGQGSTSINVTLGSSTGNVCVTATGACGTSAAACTPITITNAPTTPGAITGTTPVCLGSDNYSISAVSGATGYNWTTTGGGSVTSGQNTPNATITWTTSGAYIVSVTASNACGTSTQNTFPITINPPPTITISSTSTSVCSGSSATLTASGAGTGSYAWSPAGTLSSSTGSVVVATPIVSPTIYTVTGTDANNCVGKNTISLGINQTPTITVSGGGGNSQTVCGGGLVNSNVAPINFNVTPAGSFAWTNTNASIGIGNSGTSNIPGYAAPAVTGTTSINGVITVTATASGSGCPSTSATQLTYTVTINQIPGSTTAVITPANCSTNNGNIAGPTGTGGSGSYSYSWDGGVTYSSPSNYTNGAGTYTVDIKDLTTGCIFPQSFTIPNVGAPAPPAVTSSSSAVCVGATVTLTITSPVAGTTYSWTPIVGTPSTGTSYTVTISSATPNPFTVDVTATALGCIGNATTTSITVNSPPVNPVLTAPTGTNNSYCQGSPTPLTVSSGTATPTPIAVWYSANTVVNVGNSFTPPANLPAGTYTFSVIDSIPAVGGCISAPASANTVTLSLTINPLPTPPVLTAPTGTNNSYCQGSPLPLTVNTGTNTAVWYSNNVVVNTGSIFNPPANLPAGTYTYSVIDSIPAVNGCINAPQAANTVTLTLIVNPLPTAPILTSPTGTNNAYCQGSPNSLTVNTGTNTAVWYSNNTVVHTGSGFTPSANLPAGTYTFSVIDSIPAVNGCINAPQGANTVTLTLIINPTPTLNVSNGITTNSATCGQPTGGVSIPTGNVSGGTTPYTYQWYNGSSPISGATNPTLSNVVGGTYSLQVMDANMCIANISGGPGTFSVPSSSQPMASFSTTPSPAIGSIPLSILFTNTSTNASTYSWSFGDTLGLSTAISPTHVYNSVGTYTVILVASNNGSCPDTARYTVMAEIATTLIIPNVFTPNGDSKNDEFFIVNTGLTSLNCQIFNRWGQLMNTITAPQQAWDGLAPNGDKAPDGTYMFILEAHGTDGKTYKQQGTLLLTR